MLKEDELIGAIAIYRQEVRPFTDKQIELVKNFAAQAVIAIENTRLLNELRESACSSRPPPPTCSRSSAARPSTCQACSNTLVESAVRLCEADDSVILLRDDEMLVFGAASTGRSRWISTEWPLTRKWTRRSRASLMQSQSTSTTLLLAGEEFPDGHAMAMRLGHRTILGVPLLRENEAIGVIDRASAAKCARSPTSRLSWWRPSPTKR